MLRQHFRLGLREARDLPLWELEALLAMATVAEEGTGGREPRDHDHLTDADMEMGDDGSPPPIWLASLPTRPDGADAR